MFPSKLKVFLFCCFGALGPPVNECSLGLDDCDGNSTCTDTRFYFECKCNPGYKDTGSGMARTGDCEGMILTGKCYQ